MKSMYVWMDVFGTCVFRVYVTNINLVFPCRDA